MSDNIKNLLKSAEKAVILLRLLRVGEIVQAGDKECEAAGLNPWCINEGQADGSERFDPHNLKHAINEVKQELYEEHNMDPDNPCTCECCTI